VSVCWVVVAGLAVAEVVVLLAGAGPAVTAVSAVMIVAGGVALVVSRAARRRLAREVWVCGALQPLRLVRGWSSYMCTQPFDHPGDHEAIVDGVRVAVWPRFTGPGAP
jgi:hypothetical protein